MNQIYKNLIIRSSLMKNVFMKSLERPNIASSLIILNSQNLNIKRYYVNNTDTSSSFDLKYNRTSTFRDDFRPRDRSFRPRENKFNSRFNNENRFGSKEEDFNDAEPIESTGKKVDYLNKEHHSFQDFNIPHKLLDRLNELGYKEPFEIQEKTLKYTLAGRDLIGKAFTGSGKTLAFAIPIVSRIMNSQNQESRNPKCLVLSPTRELCLQLTKAIQELAPDMKCISIVGGTGYEGQIKSLNGKVDIVCATPGRLRDLMNRKNFVPDDIEIICLDEADELLNPNFIEQIHDVIELTNKKQMLMFSATINKSVYGLINKYMNDPVAVDLTDGQKQKLPSNIEHHLVKAPGSVHEEIILHCLNELKSERCIIFSNMKRDAIRINFFLNRNGIKSSDLHSDLSQRRREIILDKFRNGRLDALVATDVAARGIDIPEVDLVIQVGAPVNGIDFYIHRSGRTGRAGRIGRSILIDDGSKDSVVAMISKLVKFKNLELPSSIEQKLTFDTRTETRKFNFNNPSRNRFSDSTSDEQTYRSYSRFRQEKFDRNFSKYKNRDDYDQN